MDRLAVSGKVERSAFGSGWVVLGWAVVISVSSGLIGCQAPSGVPGLEGPYLGQDPPGMTAELFAPGIVSTDEDEGCTAFLNGGTTFVFNRLERGDTAWSFIPIYVMEARNGEWGAPHPAPFQRGYNEDNFTAGPDDVTLYFQATRPRTEGGEPSPYSRLWSVRKTADGWAQPSLLEYRAGGEQFGGYPSVTADSTVYFASSVRPGFGATDIFRTIREDGMQREAENLRPPINTEHVEIDAVVAADESYLVVTSDQPGGYGQWDLWVSFRRPDDAWTPLVNLGEGVNSSAYESRPSLSPDGKYLFFASDRRGNGDIYWVETSVIEALRISF